VHKPTPQYNFANLHRAYLDCRQNKRHTYHAAKFELRLESEILKLEQELQSHSYQISRSICFVVTSPTLREVFAATFRDRVVHHLLYNFLNPIFEPKFIAQSFACRKGKGIHPSLKYLQQCLRQVTDNGNKPAYFLHLDIKGFFMSLKKDILLAQITKFIKDPELVWLTELIIFNDPTTNFTNKSEPALFALIPPHKSLFHIPKNQGLPIGNLTSQFFANVYLNELDQFAKRKLKSKHYLRYVDDILFLAQDKEQLLGWRDEVGRFVKDQLGLDLNTKKQILQPVTKGIDWLGYVVKPNRVLVRPRVVRAFKRKLFLINQDLQNLNQKREVLTKKEVEKILATVNSYFGFFRHADTFKLRTKLWDKHFGLIKDYLEPKKAEELGHPRELISFRIREDFIKKIRESPITLIPISERTQRT
jgi:hypothetical protein